jgi:2-methylisocitrate lyase-like PEP mutase family enzyme
MKATLAKGELVIAPGAWDAITARLFRHMGFNALYVPAFQTGVVLGSSAPLTTLTELAMVVERVSEGVQDGVPVIVDAGSGFGGAIQVTRTVEVLEDAGATALQLDDQLFPLGAKALRGVVEVVSTDVFQQRVACALMARSSKDFLIIATTQALASEGREETLRRANAAIGAGADGVAVNGLEDEDGHRWFRERIKDVPMLASAGFGPLGVNELRSLGYQVVDYPELSIYTSLRGVFDTWQSVADTGHLLPQRPESMQIINKLLELEEKWAVESATTEAASAAPAGR